MRLSESEIRALMLVAGSEKALRPRDPSKALNLRPESLSRVVIDLVNKGLLEREGKEIALASVGLDFDAIYEDVTSSRHEDRSLRPEFFYQKIISLIST